MYRAGLAAIVAQTAGCESLPVPAEPEALLAALEDEGVRTVLLVSENGARALSLLTEIQSRRPDMPSIVVLTEPEAAVVAEGLRRGARAFLDIASTALEVGAALAAVQAGGVYLTQRAFDLLESGRTAERAATACPLSPRQREVLALVADGMSTAEIASALGVSPRTVDSHRLAISKRLGVRSVADLIRYAIREGLVHD